MTQVFISYARADDRSFDSAVRGWVTDFVDKLQHAIVMKSGNRQVCCWMDHRLEPQCAVDETLRQRIVDSQCIVAFLSPCYLESDWCKKEMDTFVGLVGGGTANNRVFLVELLPTQREDWHEGIRSLRALQFWDAGIDQPEPMIFGWPVPNPKEDKAYWRELNSLAGNIAKQIQNLPPTALPLPTPPPAPAAAKTVWIADPTDDVLDDWEALATLLRGQGHRVLPALAGQYPYHDASLYRQALGGDLAQAHLLVQLLGGVPGKKPAWADARFVQLQADAAQAEAQRRKLCHLLWRRPDIALEAITDPAYKTLLARVAALDFAAFCQQIIDRLSPFPAATSAPLSVVINADQPDRDLGKQAQDILGELNVDATLAAEPLPTQAPAQYRQHLEAQLQDSQGVLIVYGVAPPSWVQAQHASIRKLLAMRPGIWGALLEGPPEEKPDHGLNKHSLMLLDCRRGVTAEPLRRFVETLRQGGGHV